MTWHCILFIKLRTIISVIVALLLDKLLGEPRRFHPLVGFGVLVQSVENKLYSDSKIRGFYAVALLLVPFGLLAWLAQKVFIAWLINIVLLYLAIGWQSLNAHAEQVRLALVAKELPLARQKVAYLVSRETKQLDENGISKATVESILENGCDAIFAAIFWFVLCGAPGVVIYRLANTLDAMWGYRNERYTHFGWAAAKLDDVLNYVPVRLTALSYALAGQFKQSIQCWRTQGSLWKSPNAGPVMAAGAGSLSVIVGGSEVYDGQRQNRICLGKGAPPDAQTIQKAQQLISRAVFIWVFAPSLGGVIMWLN